MPQSHRKPWRRYQFLLGHATLVWEAFCRLPALGRWPVRQVLLKQLYFTGTESLLTVSVVAMLVGLIVVAEVHDLVGANEHLTSHVLIWVIVRELAPLIAAIVMIGRSSSAFASELSTMQVNGEIKNLRNMGISPLSYLVMPRMLAMTLAGIALTFYFQTVAVSTGWAVTAWRLEISFRSEITDFFEIITFQEIAATVLKSAVFGVLVSAVSCYHGIRAKTAMTEVTQAVSKAVIRSLLSVFVADGIITVLVY